jgi:hypothetical protein
MSLSNSLSKKSNGMFYCIGDPYYRSFVVKEYFGKQTECLEKISIRKYINNKIRSFNTNSYIYDDKIAKFNIELIQNKQDEINQYENYTFFNDLYERIDELFNILKSKDEEIKILNEKIDKLEKNNLVKVEKD